MLSLMENSINSVNEYSGLYPLHWARGKITEKKPLWNWVNGALWSLKINNRAELKKSLSI